MMRKFRLFILFLTINLTAIGQGTLKNTLWQGSIGTSRILLKLFPDSLRNKLSAEFNFPDEYNTTSFMDTLVFCEDSIHTESKNSSINFKGRMLNNYTEISGIFKRHKQKKILLLKKVNKLETLILPQTPKEPFPYSIERVHYSDEISGIRFGATLTLPKQKGKCSTVIMVSGTGPQDRDGTMAGHKMFLVIADYLSRNGIAVLRVDDRGVGETTGNYAEATTNDFAKDVLSAIEFLKTRNEVDINNIGLIGHSEGGAVISIAAAQSKDVKFMISLAGLAMNGLDALRKQNIDIVETSALPEYDKKRSNEINELMFTTAYKYADSDSMEYKLNETYNNWKIKDNEYFKTLNIKYDHFRFPIYRYIQQASRPWYRFFIRYNPADYLTKVKIPILAINGDKDLMVSCKENLDRWMKLPIKGGNHDVKTVVIPSVNHLFQHCQTGDPKEYSTLDETFAPEVLKLIGNWILKL